MTEMEKQEQNVHLMEADTRKSYQVKHTQNPTKKETKSFIHNYQPLRLMVLYITLSRNFLSQKMDMQHDKPSLIGTT